MAGPSGQTAGIRRDQGFSRERRLLRADQYDRVFAQPKRSGDGYVAVLARRSEQPPSRLGLAISKRAARRACDRNRIKRAAREVFRQLDTDDAWDFVVLARSQAANADKKVLANSLRRHFNRVIAR